MLQRNTARDFGLMFAILATFANAQRLWSIMALMLMLLTVVDCDAAEFNGTLGLPGGVKLEMVKIPAGKFMMGSPSDEAGRDDDETQHEVTLTSDYWLGKYEVTQSQWKAVMGEDQNPSRFKNSGSYPVENVSWEEARSFCAKLNELLKGQMPRGYRFDLPTEAQWEYAARGGDKSKGHKYSGSSDEPPSPVVKDADSDEYTPASVSKKPEEKGLKAVGWYYENSGIPQRKPLNDATWNALNYKVAKCQTHPVGMKKPNELGLYDMSGNVYEWCRDWYDDYPTKAVSDPEGPYTGQLCVYRGGSWSLVARCCRVAYRYDRAPNYHRDDLGFRLALVPDK